MTSSNAAPISRFREGETIAGKYRIERVLGRGGMGIVVAAEHLQLRQRVAIKLLLPDAGGGAETMARFAREAQAAARVHSEHVARVIDVATLEDGSPYIVMEFLEGQDLGQLLASRGPLPLEEAVGYLLQACEGVAEAHAVGIIHRDLKPSNLFVCQRGGGRTIVKVLDFGISKAQPLGPGADPGLTRTRTTMGSPLYMSPEQISSAKNVDVRADIWSLGVTLFELLAGRTPFDGESITELVAAVLQTEPASLSDLRPGLPRALTPVIARALEKDRERRYPNVAKLAEAIAPFGAKHAAMSVERIEYALASAQGTGDSPAVGSGPRPGFANEVSAEATSAPPSPGGSTTTKPVSSGQALAAAGRRSTAGRWVALGVGAAVVIALGVFVVMKRHAASVATTAITAETETTTAPPTASTLAEPPMPTALSSGPLNALPPLTPTPPLAATESPRKSGPARAAPPPRVAPAASVGPSSAKSGATTSAPPLSSTPAPTPSCRVVQYFDSEGEARFRRECQ
jgi:serine/threonine protein kinase